MNEELREILIFTVISVFVLIVIAISAVNLDFFSSKKACQAKAQALNYSYDYKYFQGCVLIKPNGKKVLLEQLRDFN